MEFVTYKLKHKLHLLKKAPSRWPTIEAETCRNINSQTKVFCNKLVLNVHM